MYSDNALKIYEQLYFNENESLPEQVHDRVSKVISNGDKVRRKIYKDMMNNKIFRPNTPTMINAGSSVNKSVGEQLCACFVLGLEDKIESIITMWDVCAKIFSTGAGAGIPITNLREKDCETSSGKASGPLSYMKVLQSIADTVKSGNRNRGAAMLASIKYNHPDIYELIEAKVNGSLSAFNTSILVDNDFMDIVVSGERNSQTYKLVSPSSRSKIGKSLPVWDVWDKLVNSAWECGDPGLIFYDTANKYNSFPSKGDIICTNPCGEVILPNWSICVLGHLNLGAIYDEVAIKDGPDNYERFLSKLSEYAFYGSYFLDDVISVTAYPHRKFKSSMDSNRPMGLGLMGLSDFFYKNGIRYGSNESFIKFEEICYTINSSSIKASIDMVKNDKRKPIKVPKSDMNHFRDLLDFYCNGENEILQDFDKYGIRNSEWSTIAPTGSTAISADCSYGFEPCFALVWEKELQSGDSLKFVDNEFKKVLPGIAMSSGFSKEKIINDIIDNHGSIKDIPYIQNDIKNIFVTAHDVEPMKKIKMQASGQKFISLSISSTCNLPNTATKEDIVEVYTQAYKMGLKGITIYRDGSKSSQPVSFGKKNKVLKTVVRDGITIRVPTPHGSMFLTCNKDIHGKPLEIFMRLGKQGTLTNLLTNSMARIISKSLQHGIEIGVIIDALIDLKGDVFWFEIKNDSEVPVRAESIVDCLAKVLIEYFGESSMSIDGGKSGFKKCPKCGSYSMKSVSGCRGDLCVSCGFGSC